MQVGVVVSARRDSRCRTSDEVGKVWEWREKWPGQAREKQPEVEEKGC